MVLNRSYSLDVLELVNRHQKRSVIFFKVLMSPDFYTKVGRSDQQLTGQCNVYQETLE